MTVRDTVPEGATQQFHALGFTVIRGFLAGEALASLQSNLDRYIRTVVPSVPESDAFYDDPARPETLKQLHRMERDDFFQAYRTNPKWERTAEHLLGEQAAASGAEWFNKPPQTQHITPPHQDNYYFCLEPPHVLTMWLALDEVNEANGCLRYVPGSHLAGVREHGATDTLGFSQGIVDYSAADRSAETPISASPGDLLIHHGNTIHRADANGSDRHRRSFGMVFKGVSCRRDEDAFRRYQQSAGQQQASIRKS